MSQTVSKKDLAFQRSLKDIIFIDTDPMFDTDPEPVLFRFNGEHWEIFGWLDPRDEEVWLKCDCGINEFIADILEDVSLVPLVGEDCRKVKI